MKRRTLIQQCHFRHYDREGRLLWEETVHGNLLHDEGEEFISKAWASEELSVPANFYMGLDARSALAEGDSMAVSGEPSGNGYARRTVASDNVDFTVSQDSGDWQVATKTVTFAASGGAWSEVKNMFLATTSDDSGKLIASEALTTPRTLQDGDSLEASMIIKLSE